MPYLVLIAVLVLAPPAMAAQLFEFGMGKPACIAVKEKMHALPKEASDQERDRLDKVWYPACKPGYLIDGKFVPAPKD